MRRALLTLHQWLGLAAGLFLIVIAVSGSALVFENEIDRALNPAPSYVAAREQTLPIETLIARVEGAYPAEQVVGVRIGEARRAFRWTTRSPLPARRFRARSLRTSTSLPAAGPFTGS